MKVFSGAVPFRDHTSLGAVVIMAQGERPPRPTHPILTERIWSLIQRCWEHDPHSRPEITEVLQILLTPSVPHLLWRPLACLTVSSDLPNWKILITYRLPTNEHAALITSIFSSRDEIEVAQRLSGGDAQAFIDRVDQVNSHTISFLKVGDSLALIESFTLCRLGLGQPCT